uniref:Aspartate beta-hydroxylase n=1 Tax=Suricata suricatta TaxID=37032 RepID=A0A673VQT8_SURSU
MAPRKNAKGGGGNSSSGSSSSGSGSGSPGAGTSGGSSSSPGARRDTKHGGHKNGRKGGLSGSSFFTWFMVLALLGVWTSVAVVWFDLVDYEEVLGKLGVYDADGDGDFDVDDAKVLLGLKERSASEPTVPAEEAEPSPWLGEQVPEGSGPQNIDDEVQEQIQAVHHETVYTEHGDDLHQEDDGPAGTPPPEDEDFLMGSDTDERLEPLDAGAFHEGPVEPVAGGEERTYHDADDITYQDYDEPVYEPSENEGIESSDNAVEDSNIILEEAHLSPAEQQEVPPDT